MHKKTLIQIAASAIGIAALCSEVTLVTAIVSADRDYTSAAITSNAIASVLAVFAWTNKSKKYSTDAISCIGWLGIFVIGFFLSLAFLWMDCGGTLPAFRPTFVCDGHRGISVIFTISALSLTAIALPSAMRAWILEMFDHAS